MASSLPRRVPFRRSDPGPLIDIVEQLAVEHRGWVNVGPDLADDDAARRRGGWFSARGPAAPNATFLAGQARRSGRHDPDQIGIEHASGTKAARRLAEGGHPVPQGWTVRQDHPKRGLVVQLPVGIPAGDVVAWLLEAAGLLCRVPTGDDWRAEVWEG